MLKQKLDVLKWCLHPRWLSAMSSSVDRCLALNLGHTRRGGGKMIWCVEHDRGLILEGAAVGGVCSRHQHSQDDGCDLWKLTEFNSDSRFEFDAQIHLK
ncbi:hypothetical protein Taro_023100 [Colocasia esculenta]|uniref:Uncharacterized protein n=1 Tax=Colocasia esculenta TaxID=4460 RepID=A0A843VAB7_COLES|nr:hypothetical protein [Colocasia esculenta]